MSETKLDKGEARRRGIPIVRFLCWAALNGLFAWAVWLSVNGSEGAGRLVGFFAWTIGPLQFLGGMMKDVRNDVAKKGRSVPAWLSHGWGFALIAFLAFHGWINVAVALLLAEIGEAATFNKSNEQ